MVGVRFSRYIPPLLRDRGEGKFRHEQIIYPDSNNNPEYQHCYYGCCSQSIDFICWKFLCHLSCAMVLVQIGADACAFTQQNLGTQDHDQLYVPVLMKLLPFFLFVFQNKVVSNSRSFIGSIIARS